MKSIGIIRAGGVALVTAALSFTAVFLYLASRFNYPEVLDAPAAEAELVALRESCFSSAAFREGIEAFAEKRKPEWQGR